MAQLFFSLRGVPEDEAEDIRQLLTENAIDYYQTPPGNWGISMPAIWLADDGQWERARILLDQYQKNRASSQRALYQQLKKQGQAPTFFKSIRKNPGRFIFYIAGILLILYVSVKLLYELGL
ncbi:MAG: hypothetical protein CVV13_09605 [Gammaproteobacteria bacterium HGW-Gammaproteobacteria-3]|nr:MAG: hypothetical protein CVV13_09605 [Gammaproteobacteria bacterium HGW-Gammaproteobacteria-3]